MRSRVLLNQIPCHWLISTLPFRFHDELNPTLHPPAELDAEDTKVRDRVARAAFGERSSIPVPPPTIDPATAPTHTSQTVQHASDAKVRNELGRGVFRVEGSQTTRASPTRDGAVDEFAEDEFAPSVPTSPTGGSGKMADEMVRGVH